MPGTHGEDRPSRIPGLDELRGIAILAVIFSHLLGLLVPNINDRVQIKWHAEASGPFESCAVDADGETLIFAGSSPFETERLVLEVDGHDAAVVTEPRTRNRWKARFDARALQAGPHVIRLSNGRGGELRQPFDIEVRSLWACRAWRAMGHYGVDLFFVISGFLITAILLRASEQRDGLVRFYIRRAMRIMPLALLIIALNCALDAQVRSYAVFCVFFLANLDLARLLPMGFLGVMWSLAVEEQFYIFWPVLARVPRRLWWAPVGATCLVLTASRYAPGIPMLDGLYPLGFSTSVRALPIALGAWLALSCERGDGPPPLACAGASMAWLVGLACAGWQIAPFDLTATALLYATVALTVRGVAVLQIFPLRFLGIRCYGLYLWHVPVQGALRLILPGLPPALFAAVYLAVVVLVASISFRYFERPLLTRRPPTAQPPAPSAG